MRRSVSSRLSIRQISSGSAGGHCLAGGSNADRPHHHGIFHSQLPGQSEHGVHNAVVIPALQRLKTWDYKLQSLLCALQTGLDFFVDEQLPVVLRQAVEEVQLLRMSLRTQQGAALQRAAMAAAS